MLQLVFPVWYQVYEMRVELNRYRGGLPCLLNAVRQPYQHDFHPIA